MKFKRLSVSIDYDGLHKPSYMYRKSPNEESAKYFGHKWYFLFHLLFWEIIVMEKA